MATGTLFAFVAVEAPPRRYAAAPPPRCPKRSRADTHAFEEERSWTAAAAARHGIRHPARPRTGREPNDRRLRAAAFRTTRQRHRALAWHRAAARVLRATRYRRARGRRHRPPGKAADGSVQESILPLRRGERRERLRRGASRTPRPRIARVGSDPRLPKECDSSCHGCLLTFGTQHDSAKLDRHKARGVSHR